MVSKYFLAPVATLALLASPVAAATVINAPPPSGGVTLIDMQDKGVARLNGQPQPTQVSVQFVAKSTETRFTFAMRADNSTFTDPRGIPHETFARLFFDDARIERVDPRTNTVLSNNEFINGDFEGGSSHLLPNGWIYDQTDPARGQTGGIIADSLIPNSQGLPTNDEFESLSDTRYNALSQTVATIPGATYDVNFFVAFTDNHPRDENGVDITDFERLAGVDFDGRPVADGLDLVLTATDAGPGTHDDGHAHFSAAEGGVAGVPEPAAWSMLIVGFGGVGAAARRRRRAAVAPGIAG